MDISFWLSSFTYAAPEKDCLLSSLKALSASSDYSHDDADILEAFATDPARTRATPKNLELTDQAMREAYEKYLAENSDLVGLSFEAWWTLERYRSGAYETLNAQLRSAQVTSINQKFAHGLMAVLRRLSATRSYRGAVYRYLGISSADLHSFLEKYSVGQVVQEPSFTSTNIVPLKLQTNVQLVIKSRTGINISFEKLPTIAEQEVLFPPGVKFRVTKLIPGDPIRPLPDSKVEWTLEMEEVP